jgi:hypothetical protein
MNLKYVCNLWKLWVLLLTLHNRIKDEWLLPYGLYKKEKRKQRRWQKREEENLNDLVCGQYKLGAKWHGQDF